MTELEQLRTVLGLPLAPLVDRGLRETTRFFRQWLHCEPLAWSSYIKGIDFHKTVETVTLRPNTRLVRYDPPDTRAKPFMFFTRPGTSPHQTGTSFERVTFKEYQTEKPILALRSFASDMTFGLHDQVSRPGGGMQYIIRTIDCPALRRVGRDGAANT